MGISKTSEDAPLSISDALFPLVRQRVLALLFGRAERSFYANEVIALAQSGSGAVQRELAALSQAGLLNVTRVGNQRHYQANSASPVFAELRGLVLKTSGLADVLRTALAPLAAQISGAFVYGSVAKQTAGASSDVDVVIVSETLAYAEAFAALEGAAASLARPVNPTLYTPAEFTRRVAQDRAFIKRVLEQPKIWLLGSERELGLLKPNTKEKIPNAETRAALAEAEEIIKFRRAFKDGLVSINESKPLAQPDIAKSARLMPTEAQLKKALAISADRAQRMAAAFGLKVPTDAPRKPKKLHQTKS